MTQISPDVLLAEDERNFVTWHPTVARLRNVFVDEARPEFIWSYQDRRTDLSGLCQTQ